MNSLSLSLSHAHSLLASQRMCFLAQSEEKHSRNLHVCVVTVMFRYKQLPRVSFPLLFFCAVRVWTSSYPLQPSVASSFPRGTAEGEREVGNPLLSRTLQIRPFEMTSTGTEITPSAYAASPPLAWPQGHVRGSAPPPTW